ncbi:hypothetical protein EJ06DRAFT_527313 [Trichodelitschia bisporula]|uniref:Arrestin-like N-terminal domain-containing protein n=1 Tax=Trichodelitschia bisporula TaxID=703511 RepID=A0A6G1I602_9PEZI|nr:hypothetical protein EJ06DRAFT_527313 [Trichodelitschia bisporula]
MPDLRLEFDFADDSRRPGSAIPVFFRHTGVKGSLRAFNVSNNDVDKIKIVLRGFLLNVVGHRCPQFQLSHDMVVEHQLLKLVDVHFSASQHSRTSDDVDCEEFPFDFKLKARSCSAPEDRHDSPIFPATTLPSSVDVLGPWCTAAAGEVNCRAETQVRYEVEAYAYRGDDAVSAAVQQVRIFDIVDAHPPPIHMADFPGEYTCSQEHKLKRSFSRSGRRMMIAVAQPKPLEISLDKDVSMVAFHVSFFVEDGPTHSSPPSTLHIRVDSLLRSTTFIALRQMDMHPTVAQARRTPFLAAVPKFGRPYHRKLHITNWTRCPPGNKVSRWWMNETVVWLPITEKSNPAPTFFTPFISRRYSVSLRFAAKGDGKANFLLQVPLQIVYPTLLGSAAPAYDAEPPQDESIELGPERLPLYVR